MEYQDVLAELGVGSAHPGGLDSTLSWIGRIQWSETMRVLDVGCGTGRSLVCLQQRFGCKGHGVDVRPKMIAKAKRRAAQAGVRTKFTVANAEALPFAEAQFDVVVTESVNVFVNASAALAEYYRVLKPCGAFIDVEMMMLGPAPDEWKQSVYQVYGVKQVPDQPGWKRMYRNAGFQDVRTLYSRQVRPTDMLNSDQQHPDDVNLISPNAFHNPQLTSILHANSKWMENHSHNLGYAVFMARK